MQQFGMINVEFCDGYVVIHAVEATHGNAVEIIVSAYKGAQDLVDAAEVIRAHHFRDSPGGNYADKPARLPATGQ
jgi:hypothetical protein